MNLTITRRYLLYLLGFMGVCLVLNFSSDVLLDFLNGDLATTEGWAAQLQEFEFFVLANLLMLPVLTLLAMHVARSMVKPVRAMAQTAHSISRGEIDRRIETSRTDDELGRLAGELNRAFDRYAAALEQQRRFNSNAAHQLRTPLASLRSTGEVALQQPRDLHQYRETIGDMLEETTRLSHLVEQMLELSRLERGELKETMGNIDLQPVIGKVLDDYTPLAEDKGVTLAADVPAALPCRGNDILLEQLLANLIDNAIHYTPSGGTIEIAARADDTGIDLTVSDNGIGISPQDQATIFHRFEQGSQPRADGHGLGLSIVQQIARLHSGTVEVTSPPGGGARFHTRIPAHAA